jgi:hypothetical protein
VVEIASGLMPTDRVIENPPDGIGTGADVHVAGAESVARTQGQGKQKNDRV